MAKVDKIEIGSWVTLNHYSIVEIMADAGFDWLCVDLEHSVIDFFEAQQLIAMIQSKGISAFVRVGKNDELIIKRMLDAGADGIIIPMIKNRADAEKAVEIINYPPIGSRGVGLARAQGYGFDFENYKSNKSKKIKIVLQIEHIDAIHNLDEILSTGSIYGTMIGPYDLSGSMGKPGKYDDSDVIDILKLYEKKSKKHNIKMGFHVIKPQHKLVLEKIISGYSFIAFSLDTVFLGKICRIEMKKLRKKLK